VDGPVVDASPVDCPCPLEVRRAADYGVVSAFVVPDVQLDPVVPDRVGPFFLAQAAHLGLQEEGLRLGAPLERLRKLDLPYVPVAGVGDDEVDARVVGFRDLSFSIIRSVLHAPGKEYVHPVLLVRGYGVDAVGVGNLITR